MLDSFSARRRVAVLALMPVTFVALACNGVGGWSDASTRPDPATLPAVAYDDPGGCPDGSVAHVVGAVDYDRGAWLDASGRVLAWSALEDTCAVPA